MSAIPEYNGFYADVDIDFESHILHGHISNITDLVTFESTDVSGIIREFHSAVDDYLDACSEVHKAPAFIDKPAVSA